MIDIISPFDSLAQAQIRQHLTENDFAPSFSLKYKLYYSILRPLIPTSIRQKLQRRYRASVVYKRDFIDSELVDLIKSFPSSASISEQLYPSPHKCAIVLTHDVESEEGLKFIPKVMELESKYGFCSSWNIVPYKYSIDKGILRAISEAGHEIGIHGYNHDGKLYYSEKIFNERVPHINRALKEYNAVGFRSPILHRNLLWLQRLDIQYDASCFDYDPFQPFPGGTGSIWPFIAGKFVELPCTMPQEHTLFYYMKEKNIDIWRKKADWIIENRGTVLTLTHPDYLMEKNYLALYGELLEYLRSIPNSWKCLPREMAQWWLKGSVWRQK